MESSLDKEEFRESAASPAGERTVARERVFTEPIDDAGIIFLETRIAPDGTKRIRKVTRKGWPVLTLEDRLKMTSKYPPEPDCAP